MARVCCLVEFRVRAKAVAAGSDAGFRWMNTIRRAGSWPSGWPGSSGGLPSVLQDTERRADRRVCGWQALGQEVPARSGGPSRALTAQAGLSACSGRRFALEVRAINRFQEMVYGVQLPGECPSGMMFAPTGFMSSRQQGGRDPCSAGSLTSISSRTDRPSRRQEHEQSQRPSQ